MTSSPDPEAIFQIQVFGGHTTLVMSVADEPRMDPVEMVTRATKALQAELDELVHCPIHMAHRR